MSKNKFRRTFDWRFLLTLLLIGSVAWFFYDRTEKSADDWAALRETIESQEAQLANDNASITALRGVVDELRQRCADAEDCDTLSLQEILNQIPETSADIAGRDGRDGARGSKGAPGRDGTPGPPGEVGARGEDGTPGVPGKDGAPGRDGVDGAPGQSAYPFSFSFSVPGLFPEGDVYYTVTCEAPGSCTTTGGN